MALHLKRLLIGRPLPNTAQDEQRLSNFTGLAIFASDALSSVAYATEEILLSLALVTAVNFTPIIPISFAIITLISIVIFSYRQTIHSYPSGGGAYIVAKENLGHNPGLVAAAALLLDYTLTVSVSVAAGVAAITSAFPAMADHRVQLAIIAVIMITVANLRGVKESGHLFAPPSYAFIIIIFILIFRGLYLIATGQDTMPVTEAFQFSMEGISTFALLRAFASGCTALTGIEAVSNGVKAFRPPEAANASKVLVRLGILLGCMFFGISFLARHFHIMPSADETVLSQLARILFGDGIMYLVVQTVTVAILFLAANTSFNGFPRLCSLLAKDRYLPRQLQQLGDRLVYSKAILLLAFFSCALLFVFSADTHGLIPLYAVGVFLSFTLSQYGMFVHLVKRKESGWRMKSSISAIGGTVTGIVLIVIMIAKFSHGAWIIFLAMPTMVIWFHAIFHHYESVQRDLQLDEQIEFKPIKNHVVIPISNIHKGVVDALIYGYTLSSDVQSISIVDNDQQEALLREKWNSIVPGLPLVVIKNQFRSVVRPLVEFIKKQKEDNPDDIVTVVIPSFVPSKWWHHLLHNQSSAMLQLALRNQRNVIVTNVHVHLK